MSVLSALECFALRADHSSSNGEFLQLKHYKSEGATRIAATAGSNPSGNPRARFFVEPSEELGGSMVHIRSCYNNKYWAPHPEPDGGWSSIRAVHERDDDPSSSSCTLFDAIITTHAQEMYIRLRHGSLQSVIIKGGRPDLQLDLQEEASTFRVFGLSRRNELPKYVAFKGDNGRYLRYNDIWLRFDSEDVLDEGAICTVHTNADGTVQIKSNMGGYWRVRRDYGASAWIAADIPYANDDNPDMAFKVITGAEDEKDKGFIIALQNMGNHNLCNRLNDRGVSYFSASSKSISQWARFKVEEPVASRKMFDVEFNLDEARIYNNALVVLDQDERTNLTSSVQTGSFSFAARTGVATSWETTVSSMSKTNYQAEISGTLPEIPIVVNAGVTLSREDASSRILAGDLDESEETTDTQNYTVQPGETITARFVATQASCDVPYSYKQKIGLTNGETIVTVHEDGIYTGVNKSNFHITVTRSIANTN